MTPEDYRDTVHQFLRTGILFFLLPMALMAGALWLTNKVLAWKTWLDHNRQELPTDDQ